MKLPLAAALWIGLASPALAVELVPVVKLDALGGQFFFEDKNTSFSGNADWLASPGLKLSSRDMLVPTVSGQYRRTREVTELLGGGFLTQEQLDNTVALKWVHALSDHWAVKPNVSFKNEFITESVDDKLGKGLFDFTKLGSGVEVERLGKRLKSLRQSFNTYQVRFPHYRSLASLDQALLGIEIKSGARVLDFDAYDYAVSGDYLLDGKTLLTGASLVSYRPFRDQKTVTLNGTFAGTNRKDLFLYWTGGVQRRLPDLQSGDATWAEVIGGVGLSYTRLFSNQNDYDAGHSRFTSAYYNYGEFSVAPSLALKIGKRLVTSLAYTYTRRDYSQRNLQDVNGNYVPGLVLLETDSVTANVSYALTKHFSLKLQGAHLDARSNMKFEKAYRYNYTSRNYFVGFGYTY